MTNKEERPPCAKVTGRVTDMVLTAPAKYLNMLDKSKAVIFYEENKGRYPLRAIVLLVRGTFFVKTLPVAWKQLARGERFRSGKNKLRIIAHYCAARRLELLLQ